jgi:hypothetical protein
VSPESISRKLKKRPLSCTDEMDTAGENKGSDDAFCPHIGCGRNYTDPTGDIISPNFPRQYDNNMNCIYTIEADNQSLVLLTTVAFHLEGEVILFITPAE